MYETAKNIFMPFNSGGLIDVKREHALLPGIGVSKMNGATANSDKGTLLLLYNSYNAVWCT